MLIDLANIRLDGGTQPRAVINSPLFEEYAQAIAEGASFPAIVVFYDGTDYWLADGFHRFHAHETLGLAQIDADVRQGDRRAAVLHSVGANADHGWRRTNDDKRRAVAALLADNEWAHWSDAEIARRCRVSQPFVSKMRPVTYNVIGDDQRTYRDRHGNTSTMNVEPLRAVRNAAALVAGRVPDAKPQPEIAASAEIGIGTASVATGIKSDKLARIARSGEIEGARKDGAAWVFDTAKLKDWMAGPEAEPEPEPLAYDHEANRPMHAAIDLIEALVTGVSPAALLDWWASYLGKGFEGDAVAGARNWINYFAEGYPAAERSRQALLSRIPQEEAA